MNLSRGGFVPLLVAVLASGASGQPGVVDTFDRLTGWNAVHSHGDASKIALSLGEGRTGGCLTLSYAFQGHMGSVAAEKKLDCVLPANYQIAFDLRGEGLPNNFIIRLMDTLDNVWVVMRSDFVPPRSWTRMVIRKDQIRYGWGPSGNSVLRHLDRINLMLDVIDGGSGTLEFDNLAIEPVEEGSGRVPTVQVSSADPLHEPAMSRDGSTMTGWKCSGTGGREWMTFDFHRVRVLGGVVIDWDGESFPREMDVLIPDSAKGWTRVYAVTRGAGGRSTVPLPGLTAGKMRLEFRDGRRGYAISRLELKGPEFSFSMNDLFAALAADARRGEYPKYLRQQQSYWTVVGAPGDEREALINEQGMIETDKRSFSLEPFLYENGTLVTWNDVEITQSLEQGFLPIPSVRWDYAKKLRLVTTACVAKTTERSILLIRYVVENTGRERSHGTLFVAIRPFQVNPPWQTFTIVGGAARIDSISYDQLLRVNAQVVAPLTPPDAFGAAEFDQGHVTAYLRSGRVPPEAAVRDHFGYASGALAFDYRLAAGERRTVVVAVPFRGTPPALRAGQTADGYYEAELRRTVDEWKAKITTVSISLPASAPPLEATIRSNLAYILINADGPGLQPGSRSYERSWLRDGALTSTALLQMGITREVREYIDWYACYQYPDGMIPCIVESRGPEPIPEHDSHGQFIYAIRQYFAFTRDTTWLRGKWDAVVRTVKYIQSLRASRTTEQYRSGTPEQRACYGLVPESISHEGYCPKPMHSYWDDLFILLGLKDAVAIATALGEERQAKEFARERDDFRKDLYASMRLVMSARKIPFIPGCVELGEFSGLSTTVALDPCGELGALPEPALTTTFLESYRQLTERWNGTVQWDAYLPYEARFIGAFVRLGWKDRANAVLNSLMKDRRPAAWNTWGEIVSRDPAAPMSVGDMPHSWAASDWIRSVRSMFAYERDEDSTIVVGAGLPEAWVNDPRGVDVRNLPTTYGRLSFSAMSTACGIVFTLAGDLPPGGVLVCPPRSGEQVTVTGDVAGRGPHGEAVIRRLPASIQFEYH